MVIFIVFFIANIKVGNMIHRFCLPMAFRFRKHKGHDLTYDVSESKYRCIRVYVWFKDDTHVICMWIWLILKYISLLERIWSLQYFRIFTNKHILQEVQYIFEIYCKLLSIRGHKSLFNTINNAYSIGLSHKSTKCLVRNVSFISELIVFLPQ
jgi:hypothetical protein